MTFGNIKFHLPIGLPLGKAADLLKPVTVVMSVTVLSRVVTGFVDTVTAMSRVVTGHLLGCHGLSRVLLKLSRECNGNVTEMSQLFLETSRVHEMYCTNVIFIIYQVMKYRKILIQ